MRVVRKQRGVERQAARTEQPRPLDELDEGVAPARRAELLIDLFLLARHAHDRTEQLIACRLLPRRGLEPESLLLEKAAREQPALVGARRAPAP